MNKWKEIAKVFDLKLNEKFEVVGFEGLVFAFTEHGLGTTYTGERTDCFIVDYVLYELISGKAEIIKKPWKPKISEEFWYWSVNQEDTYSSHFVDITGDLLLWKSGNCFKTKEEAETKGREIMEQIRKEFEDE